MLHLLLLTTWTFLFVRPPRFCYLMVTTCPYIVWIKWISSWSSGQYIWNYSLFWTCWCFFSPQWQSWHSAWLWFPGELCVAGDDQRDRGEVGLPLQPWKPWHILWGTASVDSLLCKRFVDCVQSHCSVFDWVVSPPLCFFSSVTVRVWSLCGSLNVSAARRPVWRDWEYTPHIPASTTNGTCLSTFNYGAFYLNMIYTVHTKASIYYTMCSAPPRRLFCTHFTPWLSSCVEVRYVPRFSLPLSLFVTQHVQHYTLIPEEMVWKCIFYPHNQTTSCLPSLCETAFHSAFECACSEHL